MSLYQCLLVFKFSAIMIYAGGLTAAFVSNDLNLRKNAVHLIASPSLLVVWIAGYILAEIMGIPKSSGWILGGFAFSLLSLAALIHSVSAAKRTVLAFVMAAGPMILIILLMVVKPNNWKVFA